MIRGRDGGVPDRQEVHRRLAALERQLRERGVASLAIFGSVARGDAQLDSDIDIPIDPDPDVRFSLIDLLSVRNLIEDASVTRWILSPARAYA